MDKVVEEYGDIFTSPIGVPLHCQVKHQIDLTYEPHFNSVQRPIVATYLLKDSYQRPSKFYFHSLCKKILIL